LGSVKSFEGFHEKNWLLVDKLPGAVSMQSALYYCLITYFRNPAIQYLFMGTKVLVTEWTNV